MNITEILRANAEQFPDGIAIIDRTGPRVRQTSFAELDEAIGKMATYLRASGLKAGDTVLLFHTMSAELYMALGAILRGGMTAMFVDPSAGRQYIDRCCDLLPPQALIASPKAHLLRLLSPALRRIPVKWSVGRRVPFTRCLDNYASWRNDLVVSPCKCETPALASFTSGSTGEPKAAIRTHGFLHAQHHAVEKNLSLTPGEVELVTMPIFVLANLASRVTSVIADADLRRVAEVQPEPIVRQLQDHRVDRVTASPAFFERIVEFCERERLHFDSLRKVFTGGGPVPPRLLDRLQAMAPEAEISVVYGSTEAEPISTITNHEIEPQDTAAMSSGDGLLVGKPVESLDVRIMRDKWGHSIGKLSHGEFSNCCLPPGQPGEIVVSGPHVLAGYLNGQATQENKFRVDQTSWHRTGDAGYFDSHGRLWLLGRCSARVEDGHGALYPLGVEQAAIKNPQIGQAAMVSHRGQRVLAVTLRDPNSQPDVACLLESLAFANVDAIRILKRVPVDRRHQSKIDYPSLHQMLEQ